MLEAKSLARRGDDDDDEEDVDEDEEGDEAAAAEKPKACAWAHKMPPNFPRGRIQESLEAAKLEVSEGNGGEPKRRRKGRGVENEEAATAANPPSTRLARTRCLTNFRAADSGKV